MSPGPGGWRSPRRRALVHPPGRGAAGRGHGALGGAPVTARWPPRSRTRPCRAIECLQLDPPRSRCGCLLAPDGPGSPGMRGGEGWGWGVGVCGWACTVRLGSANTTQFTRHTRPPTPSKHHPRLAPWGMSKREVRAAASDRSGRVEPRPPPPPPCHTAGWYRTARYTQNPHLGALQQPRRNVAPAPCHPRAAALIPKKSLTDIHICACAPGHPPSAGPAGTTPSTANPSPTGSESAVLNLGPNLC